jgi:hypothetical protein
LLLEQSLGAGGIADWPAGTGARRSRTGVRGAIVALADRRETARALLIIADAAAVGASLGLGVQFVVGADLRLAAILTIPFAIVLARMFGLY